MIDGLIHLSLPVISVTTTWLIARRRISGVVAALASQPLWIATACIHRQWGAVVVTSLLNCGSLALGIRAWYREQEQLRHAEPGDARVDEARGRTSAIGLEEGA